MLVKRLSRSEAREAMNIWIDSNGKLPIEVDGIYKDLRELIVNEYDKLAETYGRDGNQSYDKYRLDTQLGMLLYSYLKKATWFSERTAEDDGFWMYLSLKVVPDIVAKRWNFDNEDHYWKKSVRIWLKVLWWYVHLSWQGNDSKTAELLLSNNFNTDTILNLVERVGRDGIYVDVYRKIMYYYGHLDVKTISNYGSKNGDTDKKRTLFRSLMILHNATCVVIEPGLYPGGADGYVKNKLLKELLGQGGNI